MNLRQALRIKHNVCMAIVGAGGKTTLMFRLARQLPPSAIVTTTTHLGIEQRLLADHHFYINSLADLDFLEANPPYGVTLVTGSQVGERISSLAPDALLRLSEIVREKNFPLIIEADGSRSLPVKAPSGHEPAIPPWVDTVVNVVGLSALGKPFSPEVVHRYEEFALLSGLNNLAPITLEALYKVLAHPNGGLKNIPLGARKIVVLNQADTQDIVVVEKLAMALRNTYDAALVGFLNSRDPEGEVLSVHEPIAGIILAAGASTRMGLPKILLEWNGKPFLRIVAENALKADLHPVIVVVGAIKEQAEKILEGLSVCIVENERWEDGQSTSVVKGLTALSQSVGGAIFLLADQPQVPYELLTELVRLHAHSLSPIVAPRVNGRRANPVLFDATTFSSMFQLTGDSGGRQLFSQFPLEWLDWPDERILLDVDTEDDYLQLKKIVQ
ncbi:MAG: putative selenium-dependent hydroxylase accessory protein YqeC [Anaerolineae bacterium]|nr:putative selenium-dependent hydroxylase accessory protein YqeC [Anaerolineae bacterium]